MKARIHELLIGWSSLVFAAIALGAIATGKAQQVGIPTTVVHTIRPVTVPDAAFTATIVPNPALGLGRPLGQLVVLQDERGGSIAGHRLRFLAYQREGIKVELHGSCYSACTMILGYVPRDMLCIAQGAFLAFHSAQTVDKRRHAEGTVAMYLTYPKAIRDWIDEQGGLTKLPGPGAGYWTLYDRDLWRLGYPKCR